MAAKYELWIRDANADFTQTQIGEYEELIYSRRVGRVGAFSLLLPRDTDVPLARDMRLVIYRKPTGGHKTLEFAGLIRYWKSYTAGHRSRVLVQGPDYNHILARRVIAYAQGSSGALKINPADNVMKGYVVENLGWWAPAGRAISAFGFTIEPWLGAGPVIAKEAPYASLLKTLQEISANAYQLGTPTYFGIVPLGSGWPMEFRTRINQWGQDHRDVVGADGPVIFSLARGNMADPELEFDTQDEETYIYGSGPGEKDDCIFTYAEDPARSTASVLNRIEGFYDAKSLTVPGALQSGTDACLHKGQPRRRFTFKPVDVDGCRYGVQWGLGDRCTADYEGIQFDFHIANVTVALKGKRETITAAIEEVPA